MIGRLVHLLIVLVASTLVLSVRVDAQYADIGTVLVVNSEPSSIIRARDLTFATLSSLSAPTVSSPSVAAGSNSGLLEVTGIRNKGSANLRLTFPTSLTNISRPSSSIPVLWDGGNLVTCTRTTANACSAATRTWTVPTAPANATSYSFDVTACAVYTSGSSFTCSTANSAKWVSSETLYVSIGGRVSPTSTQESGTYQQSITLTLISLN